MRYCYQCNQITPGEPLFCNGCGRSYNVKLCPRLHANPRHAQACAQCGSRDLSTPQPRVPLWTHLLQFLLSLVPGLVLGILTVGAVIAFLNFLLNRPGMLASLLPFGLALAILWWMWAQIPAWFRKAVYRMLLRKRRGNGRREDR